MRKIVFVLCLASMLIAPQVASALPNCSTGTCVYLPIIIGATPVSEVAVVSSNAFVPYAGSTSLYIVGEVTNNAASNVRFVRVTANLRDAGGGIVASSWSYIYIGILTPGMLSPFLIIFSNTPAWATYDLTLTWSTTTNSLYALELRDLVASFDGSEAYHIRGSVKNQHAVQRTSVKLFLTMYDSQDHVIGVAKADASPSTLQPGQVIPFDINAYFWKYKPDRSKIARYLIQAYGE
jgi:hypothetical protein